MFTNDRNAAISLLKQGKPPGNSEILDEISVGIDFITDFWREKYLDEYIAFGGSRIQFITGRTGSGKSHFIEYFLDKASGYKTVSFSAAAIWVHDFKEIYAEILRQCDINDCLRLCSEKLIREMGFSQSDISENATFVDYLADIDLLDPITKREIRSQLSEMFLKNPLIDNNFALVCSLLTGGMLGHPSLEEHNKEILLGWMEGRKDIKLADIRSLGLSPSRVSKYNARHMLRSLIEIVKLAGYKGIIVAIDELDILANKAGNEFIRYTKMKRDEAYESIRELIDQIDTLKNIMFLFSLNRKLIDDEAIGLKSYIALWMRIQTEIVSENPNRFANILDLDRLPAHNVDTIVRMSENFAKVLNSADSSLKPIGVDQAQELLSHAKFGNMSLPRQVLIATANFSEGDYK